MSSLAPDQPAPSLSLSPNSSSTDNSSPIQPTQDTIVGLDLAAQLVPQDLSDVTLRTAIGGGTDARLTSEEGTVSHSTLVPRLPPPIPPRRTPSSRLHSSRNIGSMIEVPSPERVSSNLRVTSKRRSHSGLENSPAFLLPRTGVPSEPGVQKSRGRLLSANIAESDVLLGEIAGQSAQEFRRSTYCKQLSYKLRLVLQSSRTLLSAASLHADCDGGSGGGGGGSGGGCSGDNGQSEEKCLQSQLVTLLKGVLAQRGWMEEVLEGGLVLETLRMVTPLSDAQYVILHNMLQTILLCYLFCVLIMLSLSHTTPTSHFHHMHTTPTPTPHPPLTHTTQHYTHTHIPHTPLTLPHHITPTFTHIPHIPLTLLHHTHHSHTHHTHTHITHIPHTPHPPLTCTTSHIEGWRKH